MSPQGPLVTFAPLDTTRIPDALTPGALILYKLARTGRLAALADLIKIRRQGGYCGLDVVVFFLLYFAAGMTCGIRAFWTRLRPHKLAISALALRCSLTSPSSISRALSAVETDLLRTFTPAILLDLAPVDELLAHPRTQTFDTTGAPWHIFDLDPTVTTLRQRALPIHDDYPQPRRRAEMTGKPGYSGRKRGDIQFRRTTVQHAGSAIFTHAHISSANGDGLEDQALGLDSIVALVARLKHPVARTIVRLDGEFGHVPAMSACRARQLPFIVRLRRPSLYNNPVVLGALRQATFQAVPDSLSGPRRLATDLGVIELSASEDTRRADGSKYEPLRVRVVASVFATDKPAKSGKFIQGWQVELFGVDVSARAWPAPEAVALYFGRAGHENRLGQEDRELGTDRILSYELPGQELACVVGLGVWNFKVVEGFALAPPHAPPAEPAARQPLVADGPPMGWPNDPVMGRLLDQMDWQAKLDGREQWRWDKATGALVCADQRELKLTTVRQGEGRPTSLIFTRPWSGCQQCDERAECFASARPNASKHVELSVDSKLGEKLGVRLAAVRQGNDRAKAVESVAVDAGTGQWAIGEALFLPAAARRGLEEIFDSASLRMEVNKEPTTKGYLKLVANDVGERQRRRKRWAQNLARYALDASTQVHLEISGGHNLDLWLGYANAHLHRQGGTG